MVILSASARRYRPTGRRGRTMRPSSAGAWVLLALLVGGVPLAAQEPREPPQPVEITSEPGSADPINLQSASVRGDTLRLEVSHGGGCAQHLYGLRWEGSFLESLPVQVLLNLTHDAQGDVCKAIVFETLYFDLRPVREQYRQAYGATHGRMVLRFHGSDLRAVYRF
jgi:hypothetical protein